MSRPAHPKKAPQIQKVLNLKRALGLVWKSTPGWTVVSLVIVVFQSILPLGLLYTTQKLIDAVSPTVLNRTQNPGGDFGRVGLLVALAGAITIAIALFNSLSELTLEVQSLSVSDYITNLLHIKSIELDLEYYENSRYHDVLHRAQRDSTFRPTQILYALFQALQSLISLGAIAFLLLSLNWLSSFVLILAVVPGFYFRIRHINKLYFKTRNWAQLERKTTYFSALLTHEMFAKEVRLFNLGPVIKERFNKLRQQLKTERVEVARQRMFTSLLTQVSMTIVIFVAWGYIAYQTYIGALTVGALVMYYLAFQRSQGYLQGIMVNITQLYENSLFLQNFYEFLGLKKVVPEPVSPVDISSVPNACIEFKHVNFHYPNNTRPVLEDINFTIRNGQTIAIVGENGAGKTTLIKLLCRLYDPSGGQITLNGVDLCDFETSDLRKQISVVFQDYAHYNLTARENIGFGNPDLLEDNVAIQQAARYSGADGVIEKLPKAYDSMLGTLFEGSEELSVGEWQKVAIARAFLRQSPIIIMDEPTSALDAGAEFEVYEHFRQLTKGRTAILISHRLSSVRLADCIYVLEDGRITESGTHDELVDLGGTYARLFGIQAQYYRV